MTDTNFNSLLSHSLDKAIFIHKHDTVLELIAKKTEE